MKRPLGDLSSTPCRSSRYHAPSRSNSIDLFLEGNRSLSKEFNLKNAHRLLFDFFGIVLYPFLTEGELTSFTDDLGRQTNNLRAFPLFVLPLRLKHVLRERARFFQLLRRTCNTTNIRVLYIVRKKKDEKRREIYYRRLRKKEAIAFARVPRDGESLGWAAWIFTGKVNNQPRRVTLYSVFPSPLSPLRPKSKVSRQLDTASNFGVEQSPSPSSSFLSFFPPPSPRVTLLLHLAAKGKLHKAARSPSVPPLEKRPARGEPFPPNLTLSPPLKMYRSVNVRPKLKSYFPFDSNLRSR